MDLAMRRKLNRTAQDSFIRVLEKTGSVVLSCEIIGVRRETVNSEIRHNREFALQVEEAKRVSVERMEGEAYRRAVIGIEEPVFWQGELVHRVTKYSDSLLAKLLEANDPKYQRKFRVTNIGLNNETGFDLSKLSDAELDVFDKLVAKLKPVD